MKRPLLSALLGLCLVTLAPAAESLETQIKAFQQTVTAALAKTPPTTPGDRRGDSVVYAIAGLSQFSSNGANANPQELERMVASIVALTQNDPAVAKAAETLLATAKAERQTRIDRARTDIDALLKQAGETCLAAKTPADLDATLSALAPYARNSGYDRRIDDQESWQRGANAYRFVTRWQDYLGLLNQNNRKDASNILRELSGSVDTGMMPRSRLVELLATPEPAQTASAAQASADPYPAITARLEKAKTTADLVAIARDLNALPRPNQYQANPVTPIITALVDERQQVLAGTLPYNLFGTNSTNGRFLIPPQDPCYTPAAQAALLSFHRETQLAGIALALTDPALPAATDGEAADAYLLRLTSKYAAADNWIQVREALDLYRTSFNSNTPPPWLKGDITACSAYLAARNLDLAGQYPAAVASYLTALRNAGRYTPVQAIGARLAELKKTNPEAFTAAESATDDANPATRYGPNPNLPPGYGPSIPRGNPLRPAPTGPRVPASTTTATQPASTTP